MARHSKGGGNPPQRRFYNWEEVVGSMDDHISCMRGIPRVPPVVFAPPVAPPVVFRHRPWLNIGSFAAFIVAAVLIVATVPILFAVVLILPAFALIFAIWSWGTGYKVSPGTRRSIKELFYVTMVWAFYFWFVIFIMPIFVGLDMIIQYLIMQFLLYPIIVLSILFAGRWLWINTIRFAWTTAKYLYRRIRVMVG